MNLYKPKIAWLSRIQGYSISIAPSHCGTCAVLPLYSACLPCPLYLGWPGSSNYKPPFKISPSYELRLAMHEKPGFLGIDGSKAYKKNIGNYYKLRIACGFV